jgi:hypothetical protein
MFSELLLYFFLNRQVVVEEALHRPFPVSTAVLPSD